MFEQFNHQIDLFWIRDGFSVDFGSLCAQDAPRTPPGRPQESGKCGHGLTSAQTTESRTTSKGHRNEANGNFGGLLIKKTRAAKKLTPKLYLRCI